MSLWYHNNIIISIWIQYRNDMDLMLKLLLFWCQIHTKMITSLWQLYDIIIISIRYQIHMVTISWWHYHFSMDLTLNPYHSNIKSILLQYCNNIIVSICIQHWNDNNFDIESISLQCQIHIKMIMPSWYRYHMDLLSKW